MHKNPYSGHPGYQKMITMLRKEYFWPNMKNEVAEFLARCIECQQVKAEHSTQQAFCNHYEFQIGNGKSSALTL